LKVALDAGSLTPCPPRETLGFAPDQVKRFLVETCNPEGTDDLMILPDEVSSRDIAIFPQKLKELDGVRDVALVKKVTP
jgi:putative Mg2+ transporter-C (MgtC) family protein